MAGALQSAGAQETNNDSSAADAEKRGIETITVTAQKRVQNVMEVPLAIDSVSAEDLTGTSSVPLGILTNPASR